MAARTSSSSSDESKDKTSPIPANEKAKHILVTSTSTSQRMDDNSGFELPRKARIKKNRQERQLASTMEARATETAMEILTNTSPNKPNQNTRNLYLASPLQARMSREEEASSMKESDFSALWPLPDAVVHKLSTSSVDEQSLPSLEEDDHVQTHTSSFGTLVKNHDNIIRDEGDDDHRKMTFAVDEPDEAAPMVDLASTKSSDVTKQQVDVKRNDDTIFAVGGQIRNEPKKFEEPFETSTTPPWTVPEDEKTRKSVKTPPVSESEAIRPSKDLKTKIRAKPEQDMIPSKEFKTQVVPTPVAVQQKPKPLTTSKETQSLIGPKPDESKKPKEMKSFVESRADKPNALKTQVKGEEKFANPVKRDVSASSKSTKAEEEISSSSKTTSPRLTSASEVKSTSFKSTRGEDERSVSSRSTRGEDSKSITSKSSKSTRGEEEKLTPGKSNSSRVEDSKAISANTDKERLAREWTFKHSLPTDLSSLILSVGDYKQFGASPSAVVAPLSVVSFDGHTRFRITRSLHGDNVTPQSVFRRFRDFQALFLRLSYLFPAEIIPALPTAALGGLIIRFTNEEFLSVRARRLEAFLYSLLRNKPQLWGSNDLHAFLLRDSEEFDEMAVKYLGNNGKDLDVPPAPVSEKISESFTYLLRFATTSLSKEDTASTSTLSKELGEQRGEVSAAYEALGCYIDSSGTKQERIAAWETLVDSLEQVHSLTHSKMELMTSLQSSLQGLLEDETLSMAFDASGEAKFRNNLGGHQAPVGSQKSDLGCLQLAHQASCLLGGARELHLRVVHEDVLKSSPPQVLVDRFGKLKRETSGMALHVAQEYARISIEKAREERRRLEELLMTL